MAMQQIISSQASPEIIINENFESLDHMAVYGKNPATTTALTWGYYGGRYSGIAVSNGTLSLTANQTNYVVVQKSTGTISTSTSSTNWNNNSAYARVYRIVTGASTVSSYEDHRAGAFGVHGGNPTEHIMLVCSDQTTPLTAGTNKFTFRMPYGFTLTSVRASLTTAQTSGNIFTVDINESGTSILSTKLTIDNTEKTSTTAATLPVISDIVLADDAEITVDIDQIGSGTAAGLKVYLIGTKS